MPHKKKKITRKDEIQQDYVPISKEDLKYAIEIPVKTLSKDEIETVEKTKKKSSRKKSIKTTHSKSGKNQGHYSLIICEKPQAALKIASALADNGMQKRNIQGVPYYELHHKEKPVVVACAVGHLFTLTHKPHIKKSEWPVFDIEWKPNFEVRKQDFTKKYYNVINKLCKNAKDFIVATDYDVEGEVIGLNIIRYICNQKDAQRMKYSTLTANELIEAYEKRKKTLDWPQAIAGETRHFLDWIYGINLSRALMDAIKTTGKFRIMSIGRVQGPALHIIVDREKQIKAFKPEPYWQVSLDVENEHKIQVKYPRDIKKKSELEKFKKLKGEEGQATTSKRQQSLQPPVPFDLTTLQIEAYKFHNITPARTLQIAQRLYLGGLISYPRTSSQKIPISINYNKILNRLKTKFKFVENATRKTPIEGKKTDSAHPSIYPTGEFKHQISGQDKKVYELIVKRFVSCFCNDAVLDHKRIVVEIEKLKFTANGAKVKEKGWIAVYPAKLKEQELPDVNGKVKVKKVNIDEKKTQPPKRYTPASLVSELAKKNLGTKATRSMIVETLFERGYLEGKSIKATPLGISIIETLEKNSPIIIDEKLTREFEDEVEQIGKAKNLEKKKESILNKAEKSINKIEKDFRKHQKKIGKDLAKANTAFIKEQQKENQIMPCPKCKKGKLRILYNKKFKRYFVGCSNYPKCKTTYSLPPNGLIKKAEKECKECKWQMMLRIQAGKRPWEFCFNPDCPTNKEWQKKKEAYAKSYNHNKDKKEDKKK